MRVLAIDEAGGDLMWHVRVFRDLFQEIEFAELALGSPESLGVELSHIALTDRAFGSTQVARLASEAVSDEERAAVESWRSDPKREISDRSIRLTLGLR